MREREIADNSLLNAVDVGGHDLDHILCPRSQVDELVVGLAHADVDAGPFGVRDRSALRHKKRLEKDSEKTAPAIVPCAWGFELVRTCI